jgi:hypothetical protein
MKRQKNERNIHSKRIKQLEDEEMMQSTIAILPNELFTSIFTFLSDSCLIHSIGLVNHQWRIIMKQSCVWRWRRISFDSDVKILPPCCIEFIKQCDITKFNIGGANLNQIVNEFHRVVTEMNLSFQEVKFDANIDFPELQCLSGLSSWDDQNDSIIHQLKNIPKLSSLEIYGVNFNLGHIYSISKLKILHLSPYEHTETEAIEIFKQLVFLEDVKLAFSSNVTSTMWNSIFQIDGVSDRLKSIWIVQYEGDLSKKQYPSYNLKINNLTSLTISGVCNPHADLLYNSQKTLEYLVLYLHPRTSLFNITNVKLPYLKTLALNCVKCDEFVSLLSTCHSTLLSLSLSSLNSSDYIIPSDLNLSKLKRITFREIKESGIYGSLLKHLDGKNIRDMTLLHNQKVSPSLEREIIPMFSRTVNLNQLLISHSLFDLLSTFNFESLYSLSINGGLNDHTIDLLNGCTNLNSIRVIGNVSSTNTIVRILNICEYLESIIIVSKHISTVDFSVLKLHNNITRINVHYSSIQNSFETLLKYTLNLHVFKCTGLPIESYSNFLEAVDRYPVNTLVLTVQISHSGLNSFSHCHYLNNVKVRSVAMNMCVEECAHFVLPFRYYLLAALCISECSNCKLSIGSVYDKNTIECNIPVSNLKKEIIDVIELIRGTNEQKKEYLLNTLCHEQSSLMKQIIDMAKDN